MKTNNNNMFSGNATGTVRETFCAKVFAEGLSPMKAVFAFVGFSIFLFGIVTLMAVV